MSRIATICLILGLFPACVASAKADPEVGFPSVSPGREVETQALAALSDWLARTYGLPLSANPPRIAFASPRTMADRRLGAAGSDAGADIVAIYEDETETIYLPDGWTGATPGEQSVLVHELVHHLQNEGGLTYACPQAREKLAYAAQQAWLERFGRDLFDEFGTDAMTLLVRTTCAF